MIFGMVGLAALGWQLFEALRKMEIRIRGGEVIRCEDSPITFWLMVALNLPMLAVCTWLVLSGAQRVFFAN